MYVDDYAIITEPAGTPIPPHISPYLPISPHISLYLPIFPYILIHEPAGIRRPYP